MSNQKRFYCTKLRQEVSVTFSYPPHPFGRGFLPPVFDCAAFSECGIDKEESNGTHTFDWYNNCPLYSNLPKLVALYPEMQQTRRFRQKMEFNKF